MLKLPLKNGQRDPKWANTLLGYNTSNIYTIGMYGCLITALGNYTSKTPAEVNQILKDNSGFTPNSGNFIWSKCTALGLTQTYSSASYTGPVTTQGLTKIKEALDAGYPLLAEIDFNPATLTAEQHYVMLIGHDGDTITAHDPWTNTTIDMGVYGGPARAIIQFRIYDKKLENEGTTDNPDWLIRNSDSWIGTLAYLEITGNNPTLDNVKDVVGGLKARAIDMEAQKGQLEAKVISLEETIGTLNVQLTTAENDRKGLKQQLSDKERLLLESQGQVTGMIAEKKVLNEIIAELQAKRDYIVKLRIKNYFIAKYK